MDNITPGTAAILNRWRTKPKVRRTPSIATLNRWMNDGGAEATDGCWVEPDGTCPHGRSSWLIVLGLI